MIYVIKIFNTKNIGDLVSNPLLFSNLVFTEIELDKKREKDDPFFSYFNPQRDWVVIGGGGLWCYIKPDWITFLAKILDRFPERTIVWGIGINYFKENSSLPDISKVKQARLYGIRDPISSIPLLPCASCLSPLFDEYRDIKPQEEKGYYLYYRHRPHPLKIPYLICRNNCSLDVALQFLSKHKIIYTNSYHGAYWAMLLGRQCILFNCSTRKGFAIPPVFYSSKTPTIEALEALVPNSIKQNYLEECRALNFGFQKQFYQMLQEE